MKMFDTDTAVTVTLADGTTVDGTVVKETAKTIKVDVDGTVRTFRLADVTVADADDDGELLTTAELAAIFDTNAKALRVQLRKLGLGVGKGSRYGLPRTIVTMHGEAIRAGLAG
jgi:hypothetical protein